MTTTNNINVPDPKMPAQFVVSTSFGIGAIVLLLLNIGMTWQQFQTLKEETSKNSTLVTLIRENQIKGLNDIVNMKGDIANHEQRIIIVERYIIEKKAK